VSLIGQRDLSAGMFRTDARELIPANGVYDIENGLLDGPIAYKRGGAEYLAAAWTGLGSPLASIFSGRLTNGLRVVIASASGMRAYDPSTWGVLTTDAVALVSESFRPVVYKGTLLARGGGGRTYDGTTFSDIVTLGGLGFDYYAVVAGRLVGANETGDTVHFTGFDTWVFGGTDFHRIPGGGIIGLEPIRDGVAVFTTNGVWIISGLDKNLTDSDGNVQQRVDLFSRDLILWHNAAIASWRGGIVVPARDGVWLMSAGVTSEPALPFEKISGPIDDLYRGYVGAGQSPGVACVHRGHLFLPIANADGSNAMTTLVCQLDAPGRPWTRLSGHAATVGGLVQHEAAGTTRPELLAITAEPFSGGYQGRLMRCTPFDSATLVTDADGSTPAFSITTRDLPTGAGPENTITKLRVGYTLQSAGVADLTATLEDPTPVTLSGSAPESVQPETYTWPVGKKRRYGRFKIACNDQTTELTVRSLELFTRDSGKQ
jgi:hypothetical protein